MMWSKSRRAFTKSLYTTQISGRVAWYVVLAIFLFLGYSFLQPKFSARWNEQRRLTVLNDFLQEVHNSQDVDPQLLWEFRERYSPGELVVNHDFVEIGETQRIVKIASPSAEILTYRSPRLTSSENIVQTFLVDRPSSKVLDDSRLRGKKIVWFNNRLQVYFASENTLIIEFIKPISEMRRANGLFDYKNEEQEILKAGYWWHQSIVVVPDGVVQKW